MGTLVQVKPDREVLEGIAGCYIIKAIFNVFYQNPDSSYSIDDMKLKIDKGPQSTAKHLGELCDIDILFKIPGERGKSEDKFTLNKEKPELIEIFYRIVKRYNGK